MKTGQMMKQKLFLIITVMSMCLSLSAQNKGPHMSKEDFHKKKELFIAEHAKLTAEEAICFFPIYNECQMKKHELNRRIWRLHRETFRKKPSEADYEKMLREIADLRIKIETVEKEYLTRYHEVLSYEKIFAVQGAEAYFQQELLNKMSDRNNRHPQNNNNKGK